MAKDKSSGCLGIAAITGLAGLALAYYTDLGIIGLGIAGVAAIIMQHLSRVYYFRQGRNPEPEQKAPSEKNDSFHDLDKLIEYHEKGHLTKEEFEIQKKKLLDGGNN